MQRLVRTNALLALIFALAMPDLSGAQDAEGLDTEALRAQIEHNQARLGFLISDVLRRHPEFLEQRAQYSEALDRAVNQILPAAPVYRARIDELEKAHDALLENGDQAQMTQLFEEAKGMLDELFEARIEARKRPDLVKQGEALRERFMALLREADPAADELLERDSRLVLQYWAMILDGQ